MNDNLISALRNMVDDIENLGAAPQTVDVNLLKQVIAALTPPEGYEQARDAHFVCEAPGPGYWQISVEGKPYNFRAPKGFKLVPDNGPQIPEGYVLVPVVPTEAMLAEGYGWVDGPDLREAYIDMLAARPEEF